MVEPADLRLHEDAVHTHLRSDLDWEGEQTHSITDASWLNRRRRPDLSRRLRTPQLSGQPQPLDRAAAPMLSVVSPRVDYPDCAILAFLLQCGYGRVAMLVQQTFSDIDQQAAQLDGYGQHYVQLSPGRFRGEFSSFPLRGGIGVDIECVNRAMHQCASVPDDKVSVVTFMQTSGACILNGQTLCAGDSIILQPGAALDLRTPDAMTVAVVSLPVALVEGEASVLLGPRQAWRGLRTPVGLRANLKGDLLGELLSALAQEVLSKPSLLSDDRVRSAFGQTILNGLFLAVASAEEDRLEIMQPTRRWDVFAAARDMLEEGLTIGVSIQALCRAAGVSRRTLEYCFEDAVGLSPLQYVTVRRLNKIRSELSASEPGDITIGDVAARYGVWHLGRLSQQYRTLFGELPSETLKRVSSS